MERGGGFGVLGQLEVGLVGVGRGGEVKSRHRLLTERYRHYSLPFDIFVVC
ncbi:hypothetical protein SAY86_022287 [Trapa natans]|uniref:Uncharacterized protein n=1 Tax=Trapa natans TaxID=22666 RepID=A0AAN7R6U6_TRANT|nr:hypothetical protein SAY86_022287 [Trapa natans]